VVVRLIPDAQEKRFDFEVVEDVSPQELMQAAVEGTSSGGVRCPVDRLGNWMQPNQRQVTSTEQLRSSNGLRRWTNSDVVPRPEDVYQERLYCIRWVDPDTGRRYYRPPNEHDLTREQLVLDLLQERFAEWQEKGYIPSRVIEPGSKTDEPIRTRGWTHWHHLFNPRQLLLAGFVSALGNEDLLIKSESAALLLSVGKLANLNSRLCQWHSARDQTAHTFPNKA